MVRERTVGLFQVLRWWESGSRKISRIRHRNALTEKAWEDALQQKSAVFTCSKGSPWWGGGREGDKKSLLLRLTLPVERRLHGYFLNFHKQRVNGKPSFSSMRKKCLTFTLKFWLQLINRGIAQSQPPGVEENPHLALIPLPLLIASCLQENFISKRNQRAFLRSNEKLGNS